MSVLLIKTLLMKQMVKVLLEALCITSESVEKQVTQFKSHFELDSQGFHKKMAKQTLPVYKWSMLANMCVF